MDQRRASGVVEHRAGGDRAGRHGFALERAGHTGGGGRSLHHAEHRRLRPEPVAARPADDRRHGLRGRAERQHDHVLRGCGPHEAVAGQSQWLRRALSFLDHGGQRHEPGRQLHEQSSASAERRGALCAGDEHVGLSAPGQRHLRGESRAERAVLRRGHAGRRRVVQPDHQRQRPVRVRGVADATVPHVVQRPVAELPGDRAAASEHIHRAARSVRHPGVRLRRPVQHVVRRFLRPQLVVRGRCGPRRRLRRQADGHAAADADGVLHLHDERSARCAVRAAPVDEHHYGAGRRGGAIHRDRVPQGLAHPADSPGEPEELLDRHGQRLLQPWQPVERRPQRHDVRGGCGRERLHPHGPHLHPQEPLRGHERLQPAADRQLAGRGPDQGQRVRGLLARRGARRRLESGTAGDHSGRLLEHRVDDRRQLVQARPHHLRPQPQD